MISHSNLREQPSNAQLPILRRLAPLAVGLSALFTCSGCVDRSVDGNTVTYHYAPWLGYLLIFGLVALGVFGFSFCRAKGNAVLLAAVLAVLGILFIPGFFMAHVTVS